jgi:hypothetical protein
MGVWWCGSIDVGLVSMGLVCVGSPTQHIRKTASGRSTERKGRWGEGGLERERR